MSSPFRPFSCISVIYAYFLSEDTRLLEKKIESRQKDYAEVLQLKDVYESQKRAFEKAVSRKVENRGISLGVVEEMVAKNFIGGTLTALQPVTAREEKGAQRMAVDVKVTGAALGEIISFVKSADNFGLYVSKLRLSPPAANPTSLDMQATVMERRSNGNEISIWGSAPPQSEVAPLLRSLAPAHKGGGVQWITENPLLSGVVGWGILVMALVIYLFFPYQKALKIALQNVAGNGRAAVSMEGVTMKLMGIKASRILFRPDASTGQTAPFELSKVDIFWNPLSLLKGKVTIYSKAALYEGTLRCTVEGIPFIGPSDPQHIPQARSREYRQMPRRRPPLVQRHERDP